MGWLNEGGMGKLKKCEENGWQFFEMFKIFADFFRILFLKISKGIFEIFKILILLHYK